LGLDKPLHEQFLTFLGNAAQGDLGTSFVFNQPSISLILNRLPATLELAIVAVLMALVVGIPLGMLAGLKPGSLLDESVMTGSILGFSLPNFWQGIMLIMIFSVWLGWLPSTGRGQVGEIFGIQTSFATWDGIRHLLLPALNLSLFKLALVIRLTRTGVRETMPLDFVKFARAKGISERRIVMVHVFKNILIPLVTVVGLEIGSLIAFGVVTETIFAWPGIGKLLIDSIMRLDRPVVVAYLLVIVALFIFINLVVDILYSILDPRIRLGGGAR
ncbi:ABC transporter permease, partial [Lacibacterium aquatile]